MPDRAGGPEQRGRRADQDGRLEQTYPAHARVVALARRAARNACAVLLDAEACDAVELIVSELLGNAVKAATGSSVSMRLSWSSRRVRIEITDDSRAEPVARRAAVTDEGGRGLWIVDLVAVRWGSHPYKDGKCVWAEVAVST